MLEETRTEIGTNSILVTEANAEVYMGNLNAFLTLTAYDFPLENSFPRSVPAFPAIYGGYFVSFGRIFEPNDFNNTAFLFVAKLANMFVFGTQLGWFSLKDDIGIFDQLIDDQYLAQRNYLLLLCNYKLLSSTQDFLIDGRLMKPLNVLNQIPIVQQYPVVMSSIWKFKPY